MQATCTDLLSAVLIGAAYTLGGVCVLVGALLVIAKRTGIPLLPKKEPKFVEVIEE